MSMYTLYIVLDSDFYMKLSWIETSKEHTLRSTGRAELTLT